MCALSAQSPDLSPRQMQALFPDVASTSASEDAQRVFASGVADDTYKEDSEMTLIVRNVPPECTQEALLEAWADDCLFDFLYLPSNSSGKANLGCAFLNFATEAAALSFQAAALLSRRPRAACLPRPSRSSALSSLFSPLQGVTPGQGCHPLLVARIGQDSRKLAWAELESALQSRASAAVCSVCAGAHCIAGVF